MYPQSHTYTSFPCSPTTFPSRLCVFVFFFLNILSSLSVTCMCNGCRNKYWSVASLSRVYLQYTWFTPPPQSSIPTAHHLGVQLHEFSPFLLEFLTAFIFYRLCTNSHSYCEFMCATVLALSYPPKKAFVKMSRSGSHKFLVPSSAMMLEPTGKEVLYR